MVAKELFKKDIASRHNIRETARIEDDIEVSVSSSTCLCTMGLKAPLTSPEKAKEIIRQVDESQDLVHYRVEDGDLVLSSSVWVDRKPTEKGLNEIFSFLLADFKAKRMLIEAFTEGAFNA